MRRTLVLAASLLAMASCVSQPAAECNPASAYWAQFTPVDAGVGRCGELTGEWVGFAKYRAPNGGANQLAIRNEGLGHDVVNLGRVDSTDGGRERINAYGKISDHPGPNGFCEVTELVAAEQTFDALAQNAIFKRYQWLSLQIVASNNVSGTAFSGRLSYTEEDCTAVYDVFGIFPGIRCDPTQNDCNSTGVINPAFSTPEKPLTCQVYPRAIPGAHPGGYCQTQRTAAEISKL